MTDNPLVNGIRPRPRNPYYIVSPPYTRMSAGVTVLHVLCHFLNISGRSAYILQYPQTAEAGEGLRLPAQLQRVGDFPAGLIAPLITHHVVEAYDDLMLSPIVVYPEIFDNVFAAQFFVRYVLNYPGLLGPEPTQTPDLVVAYSQRLAEYVGTREVLYLCTADLSYWNTSGAAAVRSGTCFYGGKTKGLLKAEVRGAPKNSVEIEGSSMPRDQVRKIFWKSEAFYCFEDTALVTEAQLCGCPVVFVPTDHFNGIPLARAELGDDGSCLAGEPGGLQRARRTVRNQEARIRATFPAVPNRIASLATTLETLVGEAPYRGTIKFPLKPKLVYFAPTALTGATETDQAEHGASSLLAQGDLAAMHADVAAVHADLAVVHADLLAARAMADGLNQEIETLRASLSWRVTAVFRGLLDWLKSLSSTGRP